MKHSSKLVALCLFAALGLLVQGCGPETKITGTVLDNQAGTAVPGAAVLGMVWIEDADKALPTPDTKNLKPEDRDIALDKDMTDRGLPVAYARTFADSSGRFEIADFHFSADTKKAVKAMKQPKITRVTVWAFQKSYRKQAVTMFPKTSMKELPGTTMLLSRPANWKDLYVENTVNSLTEKYMLKGYSKEFGATKAEKSWIFEYTRANEQQAYDTSNIKDDKKMEEMCGHDYSDIIISTAGMQRNPAREKCGELLKRIGSIREVEELWLAHSNIKQDPLAAAKEVVGRALSAIASETAEPKEYEARIFEGLKKAVDAQSREDMRNGVSDTAWQDEAKLLYGKGDKAAAYRGLGYALYKRLPGEIQQGVLTAQLALITIPGIKDTAAGFHRLMTRPLTAQLPGGDGGNHKDKPAYKTEVSTETVEIQDYGRIKIKREKKPKTGEKEIEFHDARGNLIKQIKFDGWDILRVSRNKKIVGAQKFGFKSQTLEVYNENGEKVKTIKDIAPYRNIYLANDGSFIVAGTRNTQHLSLSGKVIFHDANGAILKAITYDVLKTNAGGYLDGSRYFAFFGRTAARGTVLECYNKSGDKTWEYLFENIPAFDAFDAFSILGNSVYIKLFSGGVKYTWVFNQNGLVEKKVGW